MAIIEENYIAQTIRQHILQRQKSEDLFVNGLQNSSHPSSPIQKNKAFAMSNGLSSAHIMDANPIIPPACLLSEIPISTRAARTVLKARNRLQSVLRNANADKL